MDGYREASLQLQEVLKEVLNAVLSETGTLLEAEFARPRKTWVRKWISRRPIHGASYQLFKELAAEDTTEYYFALRLTEDSFNILLNLVAPVIQKCDTFMRPALPAKVKLHAILYLLANGISLRVLQHLFRVPKSTTCNMISEVCDAIYNALRDYIKVGAHEIVEMEGGAAAAASWLQLEAAAARAGPWDGVLACAGPGAPPQPHPHPTVLLKATAPRSALVELRARPLITDRLPLPLWGVFTASFYTYRALRWMVGLGSHTDWLEDRHQLADGLESLRLLVDAGQLVPVLDKVYLPQDFESALAHACGEDAVGTTVIRFP